MCNDTFRYIDDIFNNNQDVEIYSWHVSWKTSTEQVKVNSADNESSILDLIKK